jgi:tetratricopeptide (TPR) repeat protein
VAPAAVEKCVVTLLAAVFAAIAATSAHLPVSTTNAQAQAAIDRGVFLYYAYDGTDATKAFARGAALDPQLAMAYWGVALARGPDLNTPITQERFDDAARAARKAVALDATASEPERRFITILALRYQGKFADWATDNAAYRNAMFAFAQSSRDENAKLLAAEALLEGGGLAWQNGALASEDSRNAFALVTAVLSDDPTSVMANHLCVHLYDLAPDRSAALPCAQRLDAAVFPPEAEHLAHMPAHYWIETGDYAKALASSERAYTLMTQLDGGLESPHGLQYAKHDVAVGYSAAMMLGNYETAQMWGHRMASVFGTGFDALTALRFGRYADAYATDGSEFGGPNVRGLAALHLGRVNDARAFAARIPAAAFAQGYIPQLFQARLAEAEGKYDEAEQWIEKSLQNQRNNLEGELIPLLPAGEALGDLRLRRGDTTGAIAAFQQTLDAYPNDPRALLGLAQALTADGASAQSQAARSRFEEAWKGADTVASDALL